MHRRLFIGALDWRVTEADLVDLVSPCAEVIATKVIIDHDTGRSRGFGFVVVETDDLQGLIRQLDGLPLAGRAIRVNEAEDRPRRERGGGGPRRRSR